jgi:5-methylcytosine-specific restriction endonuclease McrA
MQHIDLSDDALLSQLSSLCLDARRAVARTISLLIAVEDRDLDKRSACSSMWAFCTQRLHMSEGETSRRLNAVKLVRRFPSLLGWVERGEVHLSSLKILGPHLDDANLDELLGAAKWKTKMEVRELIARRYPRPDAPTIEREIAQANASLPLGTSSAPKGSRIEPLSATGYLVQTTLSKEGYDNLQRAKALMRHRVPSGETSAILERALEALVAKLEKERLATTSRPTRQVRSSKPGRIPAAVRREVFARDGEQCTYVDSQDRRCDSRTLLELDHVAPRAHDGPDKVENLRVVCRAHNKLHAEQVFGRDYVAERIDCRQHQAQRVIGEPVMAIIEQASRGLVNMGFGRSEVKRALEGSSGCVRTESTCSDWCASRSLR